MSLLEKLKDFNFRILNKPKPRIKNIDMGVFEELPHGVSLVGGETKALSKMNVGDRVIGYNVEDGKKEEYQVTGVELLDPERSYIVVNGVYPLHVHQSVMIGKDAIHANRLRKGMMMMREDGTFEEITSIKRVWDSPYPFVKLAIDGTHTFFLNGILVHNASRYAVVATFTWNGTAGSNWSAASGGAGGSSLPTTSDDVFLDGNSGAGTITVSTGNTGCLSLDCTGYTGTLAGSGALTIAGSLTLAAGMSRSYTGALTFSSTSTGRTITLNGKTTASACTFSGSGGGWTVQDAWNNSSSTIALTAGTLNTNGQTMTSGGFSTTGSTTRTLTLGASTWNITGGFTYSGSNLTLNENTSTVKVTAGFTGNGETFNNVEMNQSAGGFSGTINGANTFASLKITHASNDAIVRVAANQTITGTFTATGTNVNTARLAIAANVVGTTVTITAAAVSLTNVDFKDINANGAGIPFSGTSIGDLGGNVDITFTASRTLYKVGGTGNWNSSTMWSTSSGGASGSNRPLGQDDVIFDANSFSAGSQTLTVNCFTMGGDIDFSAVTNSPTLTLNGIGGVGVVTGSLTFSASMTLSFNASFTLTFSGGSTATFDPSGHNIDCNIESQKTGGSLTLLGDIVSSATKSFEVNAGDFDANDFDVTTGNFASSTTSVRSILMGNGTWELATTSVTLVWSTATATNLTLDSEGSTIKISGAGSGARTVSAASVVLNHLLVTAGTGNLTFTNVNVNNLDFTGFTGTLLAGTTAIACRGNFTLGAGMSITSTSQQIQLTSTSGPNTVDFNGVTLNRPVLVNGAGGSWVLADNMTIEDTRTFQISVGSFDAATFDVDCGMVSITGTGTRGLLMGSGTWRLRDVGLVWNAATTTNLAFDAETSTIEMINDAVSDQSFAGGGLDYNRLFFRGGGTGTQTISGSSHFEVLENDTDAAYTIIFTANTTQDLTDHSGWKIRGSAGKVVTIQSTSASNFNISIPSGIVVTDYLNIANSDAIGGATFYAGPNSVDTGPDNSGWIFTSPEITFSETATIVDSISNTPGKALSEAVTLVDTLARSISRSFSEAVTLVDEIAAEVASTVKTITADEVVTLVDSIVKTAGKSLSDAVTLADSLARTISRSLSETVTLVESFATSAARFLSLDEAVTLVDSVAKTAGKILSEAATVVDTFERIATRALDLVESLEIVETFIKTPYKVFTESVIVTESLSYLTKARGFIMGIARNTNTKHGNKL